MSTVIRIRVAVLAIFAFQWPAVAQTNPCYASFHSPPALSDALQSGREVTDETSRSILRAAGAFRIKVIAVSGLGTACAARPKNGERIVYYDPDWLSKYAKDSKWVIIGVLAHEVGHLTNDHSLEDGLNPWRREYEADFQVGRIVAALAGSLKNAIEAVELQPADGTSFYPPSALRIAAVTEGYEAARKSAAPEEPPRVTQVPPPKRPKSVKRICFGSGGGNNCHAGADVKLGCESYWAGAAKEENLRNSYCSWIDSQGVKHVDPAQIQQYQNNGGGGCGWTGFQITCNPDS